MKEIRESRAKFDRNSDFINARAKFNIDISSLAAAKRIEKQRNDTPCLTKHVLLHKNTGDSKEMDASA